MKPQGLVPALMAGDADRDLDFDQLDLVQVQQSALYLTGHAATWGQGDWNGAPGGTIGSPPAGDGVFDQLDIVAALTAGHYLRGPYAANAVGSPEILNVPVPEPQTSLLLGIGVFASALASVRVRSRHR